MSPLLRHVTFVDVFFHFVCLIYDYLFMALLYLLFFACLIVRYLDVEWNPGPRRVAPKKLRMLFNNINGLYGNISELGVAAVGFDLLFCVETKVTQHRHVSELLLTGFRKPNLILRGARPNGLGLAMYVRDGVAVTRMMTYECSCCELMVARVCGHRLNLYIFCVYRSPNTDDRVYDCLLDAMAKIQSVDSKAVFHFVGDFNCHHSEWLGSSRTDSHGVAARDFGSLSDCTQMVTGSTHRLGGVLDLVFTDVPDLCKVSVAAPIGRSDHSHLCVDLEITSTLPGFDVACEVPLKTRVNWDAVRRKITELPWHSIYGSGDPISVLNGHLSGLMNCYVPRVTIRKRHGDMPWFDETCRAAFQRKQTAYNRWRRSRSAIHYELFRISQREANSIYDAARLAFKLRCRDKLAHAANSRAWWCTLRESVFGTESSIPPLMKPGGALVADPASKADLLSSFFDSKQSREDVGLPQTCHPEPKLSSFAFRSSAVLKLLLDLDSYGGVDPLGFFPLFFKEIATVFSPKLSVLFRRLLKEGSFPFCWRCADVVPIPKGTVSSFTKDYRPISITPVLSKVFESLISNRLRRFMEDENLFPQHQYAYRKCLGTCDALLDICCSCQSSLDAGSESIILSIDFSAAFDRVSHVGLLHKLQAAGVGGSILAVIGNFLSSRTQSVIVDGVRSVAVRVVSGVPQGSVLGPLLFSLYTRDLSVDLTNVLVGYADDSTLVAHVPRPSDRVDVVASLNHDLESIAVWCDRWGMEVNPGKTKALIISRSRTIYPVFPGLVLNGVPVDVVPEMKLLGILLDSKLTFESQIRAIVASTSSRLGILRKVSSLYSDSEVVTRSFWSYILPLLEYCSPVWSSAAACHLSLLDRIVRRAAALSEGEVNCDLVHRRRVAFLCMFFKIFNNVDHPVRSHCPPPCVPARFTRRTAAMHDFVLLTPRCRTVQYTRSFIPACVALWNSLAVSVFEASDVSSFKSLANRFLLS